MGAIEWGSSSCSWFLMAFYFCKDFVFKVEYQQQILNPHMNRHFKKRLTKAQILINFEPGLYTYLTCTSFYYSQDRLKELSKEIFNGIHTNFAITFFATKNLIGSFL